MRLLPQNEKRKKGLIIGLLASALLMAGICISFVGGLARITENETERYLHEISGILSATVNDRIEDTFDNLRSIADTYQNLISDCAVGEAYLRRKTDIHQDIERISLYIEGEVSICSDGHSADLETLPAFQKALSGESVFERVHCSPIDGTDGIVQAIPLYNQGGIIGAISAWTYPDQMRALMETDLFNGEGYSHIIDTKGTLVVSAKNKNSQIYGETNFFDFLAARCDIESGMTVEDMKAALHARETGILIFTVDGSQPRTLHYVPLEHDGLYLLSVVMNQAAGQKFTEFVRFSILINTLVFLMFASLVVGMIVIWVRSTKKLETLAFVDPVTGGYNRTMFDNQAVLRIRRRPPGTFSCIMMNMDKFKLINDVYGSVEGDRLLRFIYVCIQKHLEPDDILCRGEADNFYMLVRTTDHNFILNKMEQIAVEINRFKNSPSSIYLITFSFGVFHIQDTEASMIQIIDRTNMARKDASAAVVRELYSCVFYSDVERLRLRREKDLENRMRDALKNGDFQLYLQPMIELKSGRTVCAEALVRWLDKDYGLIMPGDFIPLFERNGFIITLDRYVFERACALLRKWIDSGIEPVTVAVNLSQVHLHDPDFIYEYDAIRQRYGVPAGLLEVELTESMVFENPDVLIRIIDKLHELGFLCSLDDFGSGYSSLNILKDMDVDTLKLDGAFWRSVRGDGQKERSIIETVVHLGKKLHMKTVCEGIESQDQIDFLRQVECDLVQGYYYSRPLPVDEFERYVLGGAAQGGFD